MRIKVEVRDRALIQDLKNLTKEIKLSVEKGIDPTLNSAVEELKANLRTIVNRNIRVNDTIPDSTKKLPKELNIPKSKADIIKEVFGQDITKSDFVKKVLKENITADSSKVFVIKDGRLKSWQSVGDSDTYESQESMFRNRLKEGLVYDVDSGKLIKFTPDDVKGIKLECSTDTGKTVNSEKKHGNYQSSPLITRRQFNAPFSRVAVWTIKKEDLQFMQKRAIDLDAVIEKIQDGEIETAIRIFEQHNKTGAMTQAITNLQNIKQGQASTPESKNYFVILTLIRNLKIRKTIAKSKTSYRLFTNYDQSIEDSDKNFFEALRQEITLWKISNEEKWMKAIIKSVEKALQKYKSKPA